MDSSSQARYFKPSTIPKQVSPMETTMDNSCGITRNLNAYSLWPKVASDNSPALKPIPIPYLTPEERGDSQPYPIQPIKASDPKIYHKPSDWMIDDNKDADYVWPGPVQVW